MDHEYPCPWCEKGYDKERAVGTHVRRVHPEHHEEMKRRLGEQRADRAAAARLDAVAKEENARAAGFDPKDVLDHTHDTIDGGVAHSHMWASSAHDHPSGLDSPPIFRPETASVELLDPARLRKDEKSPAQKDREHAAALAEADRARKEAMVPVPPDIAEPNADVIVHVVLDGFTALGKVWYYGETIKVRRGSPVYTQTIDREGESWIELSPETQLERWGVVKFRPGEFPGARKQMSEEEFAHALAMADPVTALKMEKQRQREGLPANAPIARSTI
jgi:hypothetical protein